MTTFDRTSYLAARTSRAAARPTGPTVEQVLLNAEPVVFRIRSGFDRRGVRWHELRAYTATFQVIQFDYVNAAADNAIRLGLLRLMFEQYPCIDWRRDHDVHLVNGTVLRSPEDNEPGWLPDEDGCMGGAPAVLLERQAVTA